MINMNKIKTKILDFLPLVVLGFWFIVNIYFAFIYTYKYYYIVNFVVNTIFIVLFWLSVKFNNKYLKIKFKEKYRDE